jgi:hypothetical protein
MRVWVVVIACTVGMSGMVYGEHTVDHRYTIEGYVSNADGTPRPHELVAVMDRPDTRLGVAYTGSNGWYRLQLHLHNSDLGRLLTVETNQLRRQIRVTFDPQDATSERRHRVDFVGAQVRDAPLIPGASPPYVLLGLGAVVVLLPVLLYLRHRKTRPARHTGRRRQDTARPAPGRQRRAGRRAQ